MVWQQGEGDARDIAGMENSFNYGANLNHFIKRVRGQLNTPKMLFVYGYVIPVPLERFTGRDEVREGQKNVDQNYYLHAFDRLKAGYSVGRRISIVMNGDEYYLIRYKFVPK